MRLYSHKRLDMDVSLSGMLSKKKIMEEVIF
jgi:hypothetical protein